MLQKYLPGNFAARSCVRSGAGYAAGCGMSAPVFFCLPDPAAGRDRTCNTRRGEI